MNFNKDVKSLFGLLISGVIHCACDVSDKSTGGATQQLGITPLLKKFGQGIAEGLGSEHLKEVLNYKRVEAFLKSDRPDKINHDLENLFKEAALTAVGYIKLLLEAEIKEIPNNITINEQKEMRLHLQGAAHYLGQQLHFLKGNPMATKVEYADIDDSGNYLERLSSHVLFYRDDLPEGAREKMLHIYTTQLPYCFHLAFHEALKDEKNIKGFKAFQLRYMEESKELLKGNTEMLKVIDEKLTRLQGGESLVDGEVMERLFNDAWGEAKGFFTDRFDGVEELMGRYHEKVFGKLEVIERKVDLISQTIPQLIELNEQKDNEIKQLRQQLEEKPDARLERVLAKLMIEKDEIQQELQKSGELVKQQAKDKEDLEKQLSTYKGNDELKAKAFEEVEKGNYDEAESYLKESAKEQIKVAAETFYELGKVNKLKLNYRQALHYFDIAVKMDGENKDYLYEASVLSGTLGYYDDEIKYLEKLINATDENAAIIGTYLNNLGLAYKRKGEYDRAISYYEKALVIDKKFHGKEHPDIAIDFNNLGAAYRSKGEYDKAIGYYDKALAIDKKFYGEKHPKIATRYNNLGLAYRSKGENDKAISYYDKALVLLTKFYGEEHPNIASNYNNLGSAYFNKGEYDKAINYFDKALVLYTKFYGEEHPNIAIDYNNLGSAYDSKEEYDKAISYYDKALAIDKKFYGEAHPDIATDYNNLGIAYFNKGEYDKAIWYYEKSLAVLLKFLPPEHSYISITKENIATAIAAKENQ